MDGVTGVPGVDRDAEATALRLVLAHLAGGPDDVTLPGAATVHEIGGELVAVATDEMRGVIRALAAITVAALYTCATRLLGPDASREELLCFVRERAEAWLCEEIARE
jgi:hypothetical protein